MKHPTSTRLLVTGASGQLGAYLLREATERGIPVIGWSGSRRTTLFGVELEPVDLASAESIGRAFDAARPTVVIHAGGRSAVGDCYENPEVATAVNEIGTRHLVRRTERAGARFVFTSTDLVFDGHKAPYREKDMPAPLSMYGLTKWTAERHVLPYDRAVIARISLLFGPSLNGQTSFFEQQMAAIREGSSMTLFADEWRTPLSLGVAARALVELALSDFTGTIHIGGPERMSRLEMGQRLAAALGGDASVFESAMRDDVKSPEPRPRDVSLCSDLWRRTFPHLPWPDWKEVMRRITDSTPSAVTRHT